MVVLNLFHNFNEVCHLILFPKAHIRKQLVIDVITEIYLITFYWLANVTWLVLLLKYT